VWLESFPYWFGGARAGPESFFGLPTACAVGCILTPLRGSTPEVPAELCFGPRTWTSGATRLLRLLFCGLLWWLHFSDGNDFGVGAEFFVIAIGDVVLYVEVLQQSEAHVDFYSDVLR
jgi:hypothetical protein